MVSPENIYSAYRKARIGKSRKKSILKFESELESNLAEIRRLLLTREFRTSLYHSKRVYEPKERLIYILPFMPDRVIHHVLMNVLEPIWAPLFIRDSCACIKGRGIHSGSRRTMEFVRRNKYVLKCDISKFYPSIDQEILIRIIRRKVKDERVLWLAEDIIRSFAGGKNVPIGNYCSQWFGNLYLNELDRFVKDELRIEDYVRYSDDFCLFSDNKKLLVAARVRIEEFLAKRLLLRFSKADIFPVARGLDFLGYRHFPDYVILRKSTVRRMKRRLLRLPSKYRAREIGFEEFRGSVASTNGWLKYACTYNLRRRIGFDKIWQSVEEAGKKFRKSNRLRGGVFKEKI
jgi:retron-type reverse transcriptase